MADQKKWFKVWTSILIDPHHSNMSLQDVGRWTRLGALTVSQGDHGKLVLIPPAKTFSLLMDCANLEDAIMSIKVLPNVQIERGDNDNRTITVIIKNWFKYQMDSTGYERLKRSRYKRRLREDKDKEKNISPKSPSFLKPTALEITDYAKSIGFELVGQTFCDFYEARGWNYKRNQPMKDWRAAVRYWKTNGMKMNGGNYGTKTNYPSKGYIGAVPIAEKYTTITQDGRDTKQNTDDGRCDKIPE